MRAGSDAAGNAVTTEPAGTRVEIPVEPEVIGGRFSSRMEVVGVRQDACRHWTESARQYLKELTAFIREAAPSFVRSPNDFGLFSRNCG